MAWLRICEGNITISSVCTRGCVHKLLIHSFPVCLNSLNTRHRMLSKCFNIGITNTVNMIFCEQIHDFLVMSFLCICFNTFNAFVIGWGSFPWSGSKFYDVGVTFLSNTGIQFDQLLFILFHMCRFYRSLLHVSSKISQTTARSHSLTHTHSLACTLRDSWKEQKHNKARS